MKKIVRISAIPCALSWFWISLSCSKPIPPAPDATLPEWCRVYFSPEDDIPAQLISLIKAARQRVWAAFYSLDLPEVAQALHAAGERGIDLRVIMDDQTALAQNSQAKVLRAGNFLVTDSTPGDFMHNKFMVIDGFITWTGSYNPSSTGGLRDDNNVIVVSSRRLAASYEEEFLEMWKGLFGKKSPGPNRHTGFRIDGVEVENYFSPEDDCAARIITLIRQAGESVHFAAFSFTLNPLAEALVDKHFSGLEVRGVMEKGQDSPWSCFRLFEDCGMEVRWDQNLYYLHHKFFVIDGKTVITGSFNPSKHAQTANDENILVVHHEAVARKYLDEFRRLWERKWE